MMHAPRTTAALNAIKNRVATNGYAYLYEPKSGSDFASHKLFVITCLLIKEKYHIFYKDKRYTITKRC